MRYIIMFENDVYDILLGVVYVGFWRSFALSHSPKHTRESESRMEKMHTNTHTLNSVER